MPIPVSNGARGPIVGERITIGGEELTCIFVNGDDSRMMASDRVFAAITSNGIHHTVIGCAPFDYVRDANGVPFRGYF